MPKKTEHPPKARPAEGRALYQISQKILLYRSDEKRFLLMRNANQGGNFYTVYGPWDLPGGRIDQGEEMEVALAREIREECGEGLRYALGPSLGWYAMEYSVGPVMTVVRLASYEGGEVVIREQEHDEYRWVTADEVANGEEYKSWLKQFVAEAVERLRAQEYLDDLKRLQADFENYKKRESAQKKELSGFLIERVVADLIPVLDNFRAATGHVPAEAKDSPWVTGIQYIEKQLEKALQDHGLSVIEPQAGEQFDPAVHEAVEQASEEGKGDRVKQVVQNGYRLGERVIRPARVVVE